MQPQTIFVAESDATIGQLFHELLSEEGYHVQLLDPQLLIGGRLSVGAPDLLLLEITPATITPALTFIDQLRIQDGATKIVVLVSSTDQLLLDTHAGALGARGCITLLKPFNLERLVQRLHEQLDHRRA